MQRLIAFETIDYSGRAVATADTMKPKCSWLLDSAAKQGGDKNGTRRDGAYSAGCLLFFPFGISARRLSHSSILAPCLRMITACCETESALFQAQ